MTPPPLQPGSITRRIRILVVEEHERLAHALLQFLATEPAVEVVGSAATPDEAALKAAWAEPEVVLVDWNLPRQSAEQACRLMRQRPSAPRIVALLDDDDEPYRAAALAAGADAAVGKGQLGEALVPMLRNLFPPARPLD